MYHVMMGEGGHRWEKQNLVTQFDKSGGYDEFRCKCGLEGVSRSLGTIGIDGRKSLKEIQKCSCAAPVDLPKAVKVVNCRACGAAFGNLVPGSIHSVIDAPPPYENDSNGVWVMGVGEPVKMLNGEFKSVE